VTHSSWRTAALHAITRAAYEVFRRSPLGLRRLAIRLLTPNYTVGAVAVCEDAAGRVLLVRSRQHAGWGLPGGLVQRGEEPADGLSRELAEELSIAVPATSLTAMRQQTLIDTTAQQVTVVFAVALPGEPVVDGAEVMDAQWFAEPDLPRLLVRGTYESLAAVGAVSPRAQP
jgi:ADP-ribose pyrophosphatase YjhB (NUDIX family)